MNDKLHTRRCFLQNGLTVLSAAYTLPLFLQRTANALNNPNDSPLTQTAAGRGDDRVLIVIQLSGGNDGLATVIPHDNDDYRRARPTLSVVQNTLAVNGNISLHPNLTAFKSLYDQGELAVIQGVGYPNPNRSHFRSMEIWHTAEPEKAPTTGWLGRYFDAQCNGADPVDPKAAINIGSVAPLALHGDKFSAISFQNPESYQWFAGKRADDTSRRTFAQLNHIAPAAAQQNAAQPDMDNPDAVIPASFVTPAPRPSHNPTLDFLERTALDAQLSSDEIRNVTDRYRGGVAYPQNEFGKNLQMVAQMIAGGLSTRVYYVSLGGFDNHTQEKPAHDRLMAVLSDGVAALMKDLRAQGNHQRTMVMTFSEFGRRVSENASRGTDHGTAAPMFVLGGGVKAGVVGNHPSLRPGDLDHGDLKFGVDFRTVYATILANWLKTDSNKILGAGFKTLNFV